MSDGQDKSSGPAASSAAGPLGQGRHIVKQGECIGGIALRRGLWWETIWNDPANAELKAVRKDPNVLLPGDRLHVRPKAQRFEAGATEQTHRFERKGVESSLVIVLQDNQGKPRAAVPYTLTIDGKRSYSGRTGADGRIEHPIAHDAKRGELVLGTDDAKARHALRVSHIDPIDAVSGIQGRLNNLGYFCGPEDGELGSRTANALAAFQKDAKLPTTGAPDVATRAQLELEYGS